MAVAIAGWLSVVVLLILSAVTAPPAAAHGGPMVIFPSVDGTGRVIAVLVFERDSHFVDVENGLEVTIEVEATSSDGQTWGPMVMNSSVSGPGVWESPELLADGNWEVTVSLLAPEVKTASFEVVDRAVSPAEQPPVVAEASVDEVTAPASDRAGETSGILWMLPLGAVVLVAAAGIAVVIRSRRRVR